jgi:hypothetical protein
MTCKTAMNRNVQGCFVDAQVLFPITTLSTPDSNPSGAAERRAADYEACDGEADDG